MPFTAGGKSDSSGSSLGRRAKFKQAQRLAEEIASKQAFISSQLLLRGFDGEGSASLYRQRITSALQSHLVAHDQTHDPHYLLAPREKGTEALRQRDKKGEDEDVRSKRKETSLRLCRYLFASVFHDPETAYELQLLLQAHKGYARLGGLVCLTASRYCIMHPEIAAGTSFRLAVIGARALLRTTGEGTRSTALSRGARGSSSDTASRRAIRSQRDDTTGSASDRLNAIEHTHGVSWPFMQEFDDGKRCCTLVLQCWRRARSNWVEATLLAQELDCLGVLRDLSAILQLDQSRQADDYRVASNRLQQQKRVTCGGLGAVELMCQLHLASD